MKKNLRAFNLIFITIPAILLALLIAEVALRVSGYIYSTAIRGYSMKGMCQKNDIRFLCLGDSFTWGLGALPEKSYPMQLKELLEKNYNSSITVYNAGVPGFNSSLVLKRLNENINKYSPNFIIVMVGTNNVWNLEDSSYFLLKKINPSHLNHFERILSKIRVYKLARIWYLTIRHEEPYLLEKDIAVSINPDSMTTLQNGITMFDEGKYELAEEYFNRALLLDSHNYMAYIRKASMLAARKDYTLAKDALNKAMSLVNYYNINDFYLFDSILSTVLINPDERIDIIRKLKVLTKKYVNDAKKKKIFLDILAAKEELLEDISLHEKILIYDLSQIILLAQQKNINVILQTYPCSINVNVTIRKVSQKYAVLLVDNQKIFEEKIKYMNREDFFVSRYDRHCNAQGYRLIAENIYDVLVHNNCLPNRKKNNAHN